MQNPPPGYNAYNAAPASAAGEKSSTGLDANIASLLAYLFGLLSGIIFFVMEKNSKFVRFHAMQSILFNALIVVVSIVLVIVITVVTIVLAMINNTLAGVVSILSLLIWIGFLIGILIAFVLCMIKAYQGQIIKLPIIGNMAEKFANK